MSPAEGVSQTPDDHTKAHVYNSGAEAGGTSAQSDETNNRMAPSLVSLPWARHWAATNTLTT